MKGLFLLACFILVSLPALTQKGYEVGVMGGASVYVGDINPNFMLKTPGPTLGVLGRYNFNTRTSVRLDLFAGRLIGRDDLSENPFQQARNLNFRTDFVDTSIDLEFNFFSLVHGSRDKYFTPYVFGGLAFTYYNPMAKLDDRWYSLRQYTTEGQGDEYAQISPALSYGIGIKLDMNYEWSLNIELAARQMMNDYLDDVSTTYPNMATLASRRGEIAPLLSDRSGQLGIEPIGAEGRQRGNSRDNDSYYSLRIGFVYYIGLLQCPSISRPSTK